MYNPTTMLPTTKIATVTHPTTGLENTQFTIRQVLTSVANQTPLQIPEEVIGGYTIQTTIEGRYVLETTDKSDGTSCTYRDLVSLWQIHNFHQLLGYVVPEVSLALCTTIEFQQLTMALQQLLAQQGNTLPDLVIMAMNTRLNFHSHPNQDRRAYTDTVFKQANSQTSIQIFTNDKFVSQSGVEFIRHASNLLVNLLLGLTDEDNIGNGPAYQVYFYSEVLKELILIFLKPTEAEHLMQDTDLKLDEFRKSLRSSPNYSRAYQLVARQIAHNIDKKLLEETTFAMLLIEVMNKGHSALANILNLDEEKLVDELNTLANKNVIIRSN